jgi:glycosyltransferase involved in cell wall biosynthesis
VHGAQADYAKLVDRDFMRADRRIGIVFWELDCPIPGADDFDRIYTELWAPSTFLAEIYRRQTALPVHVMPQFAEFTGADLQEVTADPRGGHDPYALFVFDHYSVMERKNPTGVIDAFVAAVAPGDGARLVIKSMNGDRYRREYAELARRAARHSHVEVIDGFIPRTELMRLSAGASAYVSLHRGEGLGLTIAEAMAMGVPAIATAFGGNLDFMDGNNSLLVDYQTKPVGDEGYPYPGDGVWADPDIDLAAAHIAALFADRDRASAIGSRGRHDVTQCFARERQVDFLRHQGVIG